MSAVSSTAGPTTRAVARRCSSSAMSRSSNSCCSQRFAQVGILAGLAAILARDAQPRGDLGTPRGDELLLLGLQALKTLTGNDVRPIRRDRHGLPLRFAGRTTPGTRGTARQRRPSPTPQTMEPARHPPLAACRVGAARAAARARGHAGTPRRPWRQGIGAGIASRSGSRLPLSRATRDGHQNTSPRS